MGRPVILGNGRLTVGLDEHGLVHDFYYPYVGQENLTSARSVHHKIGVWVDGRFSWLDDGSWEVVVDFEEDALVGRCSYLSRQLGIQLSTEDFVDSYNDIFARSITVKNEFEQKRDVRIFFHQVFQISHNGRSDTCMLIPAKKPYLLTYHGNLSFVAGARSSDSDSFSQYAIGNYGIEGKTGTFMDAVDGDLSGNTIEHGGVDSVLGVHLSFDGRQKKNVEYWICASSTTYHDASSLHRELSAGSMFKRLNETRSGWSKWLEKTKPYTQKLPQKYVTIFKKSAMVIKVHLDEDGGVLASADSSIYNYGRDYYSYVWPRDAANVLMPMLAMGYRYEVKKYLMFAIKAIHPKGYMHHKYQPDGSIGSTWHPMLQNGQSELNIQEDETAMTLLLTCAYISSEPSSEDRQVLIDKLVIPTANFMSGYINHHLKLPHPSYDLWEEQFIISTHTTSVVIDALKKAIACGQQNGIETKRWELAVELLSANFVKLFNTSQQYFQKGLKLVGEQESSVNYIDAATMQATVEHFPGDIHNAAVEGTVKAVESSLLVEGTVGVSRYAHDQYMRKSEKSANAWPICTLWLARYYQRTNQRQKAEQLIDWVASGALHSGMISEQVSGTERTPISVTPLVWSHAELLKTLMEL